MKPVRFAERKLASYLGVKHALMTSKGRTALVVGLKALGIAHGDEVIVPSFLCNVLIKSLEYCGAEPIFADVDPLTFNVNPEEIKNKITRNTKAILVIHCYGQPADMNETLEIADENNIPMIEDVAHSLGGEYHQKKVGQFGHFSIFSFSKNLGCSTGGAITTDSNDLISRANKVLENLSAQESTISHLERSMKRNVSLTFRRSGKFLLSSPKVLGIARKFGFSTTPTNIPTLFSANKQLATEITKGLDSIDQKNEVRRRKARVLTEMIKDLKIDFINPPYEKKDRTHVYYIYSLKAKERKKTIEELRKIEKYIPWSLPWQCPYAHTAKELSKRLILLYLSPEPTEKDVHLIVSALSSTSNKRIASCHK